jgi:ABC-type Na+ efflux pump permease subunit
MKPLAPRQIFFRRLLASIAVGLLLIGVSLAVGMAGYHHYEGLPWLDAFLNASMILSGMGPLLSPVTTGGKLFAGFYALYSGLAVLVIAGVIFAPVVHRFLHRFHLEAEED